MNIIVSIVSELINYDGMIQFYADHEPEVPTTQVVEPQDDSQEESE